MKSLRDPDRLLDDGLAAIRSQFALPDGFAPEVLAAAEAAAQRKPSAHVDRRALPMLTLDPAGAVDLDQAFALESSGADVLLHYAIADVAWFVDDGDAIDREAWRRGVTTYLPDGKVSLYPPRLSEGAASLLPDGPRPAVLLTVRVDPAGAVRLDGAERALVHSRARLSYEQVRPDELPPELAEFARRMAAAEQARGASRVDPPEQVVARENGSASAAGRHRYRLHLRPLGLAERHNAALSLAANLAVAEALHAAGTGLFRVMAGPNGAAIARLRNSARAFGLHWAAEDDLPTFERQLDPADPRAQAFSLAVRRAGDGAAYHAYRTGPKPWHAAMAATYAHATAPLRRLADRWVLQAVLAVAQGRAVPDRVQQAFERLVPVMARAEDRAGQVERAVVDLAESAMLAGREGEVFDAVVTEADASGARIQLCDWPVLARTRAGGATGKLPGTRLRVRLDQADPVRRRLVFSPLEPGLHSRP